MKIILGLDPSGSFSEGGKGTTGWCIIHIESHAIIDIGSVAAEDYPTDMQYYAAVVDVIKFAKARFKQELFVVMEDYVLYAHAAQAQTNSHMETCQLLGILKYYMFLNDIPFKMQLAHQVVTRWADEVLERKGLLVNGYLKEVAFKPNPHERDAFRHALHHAMFNKNEMEENTNELPTSDPRALQGGTRSSSGFIPRGFCYAEETGPGSK